MRWVKAGLMITALLASAVAGAIVYATVVGDPTPQVAPIELREAPSGRNEAPPRKPDRKKEERRAPAPSGSDSEDTGGPSAPAPVQPAPAPAGGGDDDDDDDDDDDEESDTDD
jgi:hypothetical protein